ncbi:MAG: tripartite tricarboxylate transporter TctB family protein [Deltaproteobacteria bacterium]|jgi:putative tricarboxylic transport membrane protein|nr:tripartite tricarboxylate transporter TctB family protein [Deltaproteobacteria bacterium]
MKWTADRIVLILFIVLGGGVMAQSVRLSLGTLHNPGPGFLPFFLGLSMVVLAGLSYLEPPQKGTTVEKKFWKEEKPILFIAGGLLLYLALMKVLGFYLDTLLLIVYLMRCFGERRYRRSFTLSVAIVVVVYLIFYKLFIIPFPEGIFGL